MARGGEAVGGGPLRGRSGAREPSSLATAVAPGAQGGCALAAVLAFSRALRGPMMGVPGGRCWDSPRRQVPRGFAAPARVGGFAGAPWLSPPAGLRPGSRRQVPLVPRFSPRKVPGPRRAKVGSGIRAGGPGGGGRGRHGRCPDFTSRSRGGKRAGDSPASPATRLGWSSPWLSARGGCPPHPRGSCGATAARHWPRSPDWRSRPVFLCHTREVYLFLQQLREHLKGNG